MKILPIAIFTLGLTLIGSPARARHPDDTAGYLCSTCADNTDDQVYCLGYLRGIINTFDGEIEAGKEFALYCIPPTVTLNDIKLIWERYCDNHPKDKLSRASSLMAVALARAFPCPKVEEDQSVPQH